MIDKCYIKETPVEIIGENTHTITLEEALKSNIPVYTRARGIQELFDRGIKSVKDLITNGEGVPFDADFHKTTRDIYLYNYLFKSLHLVKENELINVW